MKLKKIISSLLVAAMAMSMSVVSFATSETKYLYFGQAEYVESQNVTVNMYFHEDVKKISGMGTMRVGYNADAFDFVSGTTSVSTATITESEDGFVDYTDEGMEEIAITDVTVPFITMVFSVADDTKIEDAPFEVILDGSGTTMLSLFYGESESLTEIFLIDDSTQDYLGKMTVTAATPEPDPEPEPDPDPVAGDIKETGDISGNKKYTIIYDNAVKERIVVEDTLAGATADADTVLKATYLTETRVAKIADLIDIDVDDGGSFTFNSFNIKMILKVDVTEVPTANDFSFVIE